MVVGSELAADVGCAVVFRNNKRTKDAMECATMEGDYLRGKGVERAADARYIKRSDSRARGHTHSVDILSSILLECVNEAAIELNIFQMIVCSAR